MGKHQPPSPIRPLCQRAAALVLASALPLSIALLSTAPATAAPQPLGNPTLTQTPYGLALVADPSAPVDDPAAFPLSPLRNATAPLPVPSAANFAAPDRQHAATRAPRTVVTPSAATPNNRIRLGTIQMDRPDWLPPEHATQINDASAGVENGLTQAIRSAGVEPARANYMARDVIGGSLIGASVGSTIASPLAATSAVVGAATGVICGFPFAPAGLIVVPIIGAAIGYAVIAAPAAVAGAAVGAVVGAIDGAIAPLPPPEEQQPAPEQQPITS